MRPVGSHRRMHFAAALAQFLFPASFLSLGPPTRAHLIKFRITQNVKCKTVSLRTIGVFFVCVLSSVVVCRPVLGPPFMCWRANSCCMGAVVLTTPALAWNRPDRVPETWGEGGDVSNEGRSSSIPGPSELSYYCRFGAHAVHQTTNMRRSRTLAGALQQAGSRSGKHKFAQ